MNYKLVRDRFTEINETVGVLENNGYGFIEVAITDSTPEIDNESNTLVEPNGKLIYKLEPSQKIYARAKTHIYTMVNVSEIDSESMGNGDIEIGNYYTKSEVDQSFVKKVEAENTYSKKEEVNNTFAKKTEVEETYAKKAELYDSELPQANGDASVGVSEKVSRADHVHPKQTDITGNAGSATKLATQRKINITGEVEGSVMFDGSGDANITTTIKNIDGNKINKLTGYTKALESTAIGVEDSLIVALGKLEKSIDDAKAPAAYKIGKQFSLHYCTKAEYELLEKSVDDSIIYLVLDEETGIIETKVYRA